MKAAVLAEPYKLEVREVPKPVPGPGEVVIDVKYMGICGSDIPGYEGKQAVKMPIIPGPVSYTHLSTTRRSTPRT